MRLPWLRIDADGMTRGEMLGMLLGVGADAGIGLAVRVWRWALEMSPDNDFSGGAHDPGALAAGIGWNPAEAERLLKELCRAGLAEVPVSAGFVRIKGLHRYQRAWEKNKRRKPALQAQVTGGMSAGTGKNPGCKTETETETSLKALRAPEAVPAVPKPEKAPKKPRELTRQFRFLEWAAKCRSETYGLADVPLAVARVNSVLKDFVARDSDICQGAYRRFLEDDYAEKCDPPCPMSLFAAQWPKYVSLYEREGDGEEPEMTEVERQLLA